MHDNGVLRPVEPMQVRHRGIERKEGVERQCRRSPIQHQRAIPPERHPVGVTDRSNGAESIKGTPKNDHEHAGIAALGACKLRQLRPGKQSA
jgi:hypothetical protein